MTILIALAIVNALFVIARRVRTFAQCESEASLGPAGFAISPLRVVATVASWICALWILMLLIIIVPERGANGALTALFVGFVAAYPVKRAISRYEQTFIHKHGVKN